MLRCPDGSGAAPDEQPGFDVVGDAGLGQVRAGDQQDLTVGDGELGGLPAGQLGEAISLTEHNRTNRQRVPGPDKTARTHQTTSNFPIPDTKTFAL